MSGTVGGALGTILGSALGFITWQNLFDTAVFAIVGAVIGFYANKLLKAIHKKFEK